MFYNLLITLITLAFLYSVVGLVVLLFKKIFGRKKGKWFSLKKIGTTFVAMIALVFVAPKTETAAQKAADQHEEARSSSLAMASEQAAKKSAELDSSRKRDNSQTKTKQLALKSAKASAQSQAIASSKAAAKQSAAELAAKQVSEAKVKSANNQEILAELVKETNNHSAGPTKDYYWENGAAKITGFDGLKSGEEKFTADSQGRSGVAKAILTYSEYESSKGSRQGDPLEPPAWPYTNPKVAITYSLTGRTYHGYLYNRSHSIGDSLLGADSYDSKYNFTTGTRPQNVGANQNGGMRYVEETAEDYWDSHPNTKNTIAYETTPLYNNSETIPRGSIVDIKSSDGIINKEIVVVNSVEGISIDYNNGSNKTIAAISSKPSSSVAPVIKSSSSSSTTVNSAPAVSSSTAPTTTPATSPTVSGGWTVAPAGQVYVSNSNKYYARVTNPGNYRLMSQSEADNQGFIRASRGNQYARPY